MSYVFGPVPSRRLGRSLGIDLIPTKICNWNCAYCQSGRTILLKNDRREYFPRQDIVAEVEAALAARRSGPIDWVTFVGSGETTLRSGAAAPNRERRLNDLKQQAEHLGAALDDVRKRTQGLETETAEK